MPQARSRAWHTDRRRLRAVAERTPRPADSKFGYLADKDIWDEAW
jgi:hypothetical protein